MLSYRHNELCTFSATSATSTTGIQVNFSVARHSWRAVDTCGWEESDRHQPCSLSRSWGGVAPQRRVALETFIWGTSMILDDSASLGLLGTVRSCVVS